MFEIHSKAPKRPTTPPIAPMDLAKELSMVRDAGLMGIRCPLCRWQPLRSSQWTCWDCVHPEYFYDGCGTDWNTFETGGRCPTCAHQWIWTLCLSCTSWSRHKDWYEHDGLISGR